jgi:hypothetical protein
MLNPTVLLNPTVNKRNFPHAPLVLQVNVVNESEPPGILRQEIEHDQGLPLILDRRQLADVRLDLLVLEHALELHLEQLRHLMLFLRALAVLLAELGDVLVEAALKCEGADGHEPVGHWQDEQFAPGVVLQCLHKDVAAVVDELEGEVILFLRSGLVPWLVALVTVVFVEVATRNFFFYFFN